MGKSLTLPAYKALISNCEETQDNFATVIQATGKNRPLKPPAAIVATMKKFPAVVKWFAANKVAYGQALTALAGDTQSRGAGG